MKHSYLWITLLGFGFFAPFACSKHKSANAKKATLHMTKHTNQNYALGGPNAKRIVQYKKA